MGDAVSNYLWANKTLWDAVEKAEPTQLLKTVRHVDYVSKLLTVIYRVAMHSSIQAFRKNPSLSHLGKLCAIGLSVAQFLSDDVVRQALSSGKSIEEKYLGEIYNIESMRECLWYSYIRAVAGTRPTRFSDYPDYCRDYWKLGLMYPHIGSLLVNHVINKGSIQSMPRYNVLTPLVAWILTVIKDIVVGSQPGERMRHGAGSLAVIGATAGRGKTTMLYYTLRAVAYALNVPNPDAAASSIILLNPNDFIDVAQALIDSDQKSLIMVVDNASALFPRYWNMYSGSIHSFYRHMDEFLTMYRKITGVTIFVANAPNELASFVRNKANIQIMGEEADYKTFSVTVFTRTMGELEVKKSEEWVRKKRKIESVYVYPLLLLPEHLYRIDMDVKKEVIAKKIAEAKKLLGMQSEGNSEVQE